MTNLANLDSLHRRSAFRTEVGRRSRQTRGARLPRQHRSVAPLIVPVPRETPTHPRGDFRTGPSVHTPASSCRLGNLRHRKKRVAGI